MGELFRRMTAAMAAANAILAALLALTFSPLTFVCLGCAVFGWMATRNRDAWRWP